ncbi:hypothetical protein CSKR_102836 [Clonorchis sinensis]|uniref:Uncharacterized protein n=1 Tax=Clonorchis sinensis TaxID=79923 RepID=A0A8T1LZD2_CLOSI|nr:hypothetical protein CSKR_102836 [Clonorchis sinensis]
MLAKHKPTEDSETEFEAELITDAAGLFEPKLTQRDNGNMLDDLNGIQENMKKGKESGEQETTISKPIRSSLPLDVDVLLESGSRTQYPKVGYTNTIDNGTHSKSLGDENGKLKYSQQLLVPKSVTNITSPGHQKTTTNTTSSRGLTANILKGLTGKQPIPITALLRHSAIMNSHTGKTKANSIANNTNSKLRTSPIKTRNLIAVSSTTEIGTTTNDESSSKPFTHSWATFMDAKSRPLVNVNRRSRKLSPVDNSVAVTTFRPLAGEKRNKLKKAEWVKAFQTPSGAKSPLRKSRRDAEQDEKVIIEPDIANPTLSVTNRSELDLLSFPWEVDTNTSIKVPSVPQEYDYDVEVDRDAEWQEVGQKAENDENGCDPCPDRTQRMRASANFTARTTIFQTDAPELQTTRSQPENSVSSRVTTTELTKSSSAKDYNLRDTDQKSGSEKLVNETSDCTERCRHKDEAGKKPATNKPNNCDPGKPKLVSVQKFPHKCSSGEEIEIRKVEITQKRVFYRNILRSFSSRLRQN